MLALGIVIGWIALRHRQGLAAPSVQHSLASVVVLPFESPEADAQTKLLSSSFAASLTSDLARFSGLTVSSQTALARLGAHPELDALRRQLHVNNVVNGSIRRTPRGFLLEIALVDAKTGTHRWGQSYVRKESDAATLDEDVSVDIAYLLRRDLNAEGKYVPAHGRTGVQAAQQAFRRGEAELAANHLDASETAATDFQEAVDADPEFAPAYERLANCYLLMANKYLRPEASSDLRAKAESLALRSVELNESSAAFMDLAKIQVFRRFDWKDAEENATRAVQLDPNDVSAHAAFAFYVLMPQGRFAEARAQLAYASRTPSRVLTNEFKGAIGEYFARHFRSSLDQLKKLRQEHPESDVLSEVITEDYIGINEAPKAIEFLKITSPQSEDGKIAQDALLGVALAKVGRKAEAAKILARLASEEKPTFGLNFHMAALSAAVGNRKSALTYLKRAEETRETSVLFVGFDALMDPLRRDPRFQDLLLEMNLENTNGAGGAV